MRGVLVSLFHRFDSTRITMVEMLGKSWNQIQEQIMAWYWQITYAQTGQYPSTDSQ
jgi:hypothetical protein